MEGEELDTEYLVGGHRQPMRLGPHGLVPPWADKFRPEHDVESLGQLPQHDDLLEWCREVASLGPTPHWRSNIFEAYREWTDTDSHRIPTSLVRAVLSSPSELGTFFRAAADVRLEGEDPPSHREGQDLLPLPYAPEAAEATIPPRQLAQHPALRLARHSYLWLAVLVLNKRWMGVRARTEEEARTSAQSCLPLGPPTPGQALALRLLMQAIEVHLDMQRRVLDLKDWGKELAARRCGTNYTGETSMPCKLAPDTAKPGLPPVSISGSVDIRHFCVGSVREVVDDPSLLIAAPDEEGPAETRIWVEDGKEIEMGRLYQEHGILAELPEGLDGMRNSRGLLLRAGNFGTPNKKKPPVERPGGERVPVLRSIFNLVPQNAWLLDFDADCLQMPPSSQTQNMVLLSRELALQMLTDRTSFFYLFDMPEWWIPVQLTGYESAAGKPLGLKTLGMGLKPAVPIAEHVHRNIVRSQENVMPVPYQPFDALPGLPAAAEIRKDRPLPFTPAKGWAAAWLAYIDDLYSCRIINHEEYQLYVNVPDVMVLVADGRYLAAQTPGDTGVKPQAVVKVLGEKSDGAVGRRDVPEGVLSDLMDFTFYMISKGAAPQVARQMLGGRWNRVVSLRRPLFNIFDETWGWIAGEKDVPMSNVVLDEFLQALVLAPHAFSSMRHPVSDLVVATDASETGGCVSCSAGLTALGTELGWEAAFLHAPKSAEALGLFTVGDGVGAVRRTLELMGMPVAATLAWVSTHAEARVVRRSYPDAEVVEAERLDEPTQALKGWLTATRLKQVRLTDLVLFVQSFSEHHEIVSMTREVLAEMNWGLSVLIVLETYDNQSKAALPRPERPDFTAQGLASAEELNVLWND